MLRFVGLSAVLLYAVLFHASLSVGPAFAGDGEFLRGDYDGNGHVDPLLDGRLLLRGVFAPATPCRAAADADSNGVVFGILDALFLLEWAYSDGAVPDDPGPFECGVDPVGDLDCDSAPAECLAVLPPAATDPDLLLRIGSATGEVEDSVTVEVSVTNSSVPLDGLEFGVCHPDSLSFDLQDVQWVPEFFDFDLAFEAVDGDSENGWHAGIMWNQINGATLEDDGETHVLYEATYTILSTEDAEVTLCTLGVEGEEYVVQPRGVEGPDGGSLTPTLENGRVMRRTKRGCGWSRSPTGLDRH